MFHVEHFGLATKAEAGSLREWKKEGQGQEQKQVQTQIPCGNDKQEG
jgi:hypothetical protein